MLQVLGLEDNSISSWCEVLRLAGLPQLRRLHLSGNPIPAITYPQQPISLAALWAAEPPVAAAACVQQQQHADAASSSSAAPAANTGGSDAGSHQQQQQQVPCFARLEALLLGNCQLSSWGDVDCLNHFPALRELRLSGNPLFASEGAAAGAGRRFEVGLAA